MKNTVYRKGITLCLPSRQVTIDLGGGPITLDWSGYPQIVESQDPLFPKEKPFHFYDSKRNTVGLPELTLPGGLTEIPEGFTPHPYVDHGVLELFDWKGFQFDLPNGVFPALPFKTEPIFETEDKCYMVDARNVLWTLTDANTWVRSLCTPDRFPQPVQRALAGILTQEKKPDWMIEAEKHGWTPPTEKV